MNAQIAVSPQQSKLDNPPIRVVSTWIWWLVGAATTVVALIFLTGN